MKPERQRAQFLPGEFPTTPFPLLGELPQAGGEEGSPLEHSDPHVKPCQKREAFQCLSGWSTFYFSVSQNVDTNLQWVTGMMPGMVASPGSKFA